MFALVPDVHLFICFDKRVSPGSLLYCMDLIRAHDWQEETILICDEAWKEYVHIDQPVLFVNREKIFSSLSENSNKEGDEYLDEFIEQLDHFEIKKVTQIGDLSWGRWIQAFFDNENSRHIEKNHIQWNHQNLSSVDFVNDMANKLDLDLSLPMKSLNKPSFVYLDPYEGASLSPTFLSLFKNLKNTDIPEWLSIVVREKDLKYFKNQRLSDAVVDFHEVDANLSHQSVFCFSDKSYFAQTSRSYNIGLFNTSTQGSIFLPGDMEISAKQNLHISQIFNILSYWKDKRLQELSFQWLNMNIDVYLVEWFHSRVTKRNILSRSAELCH